MCRRKPCKAVPRWIGTWPSVVCLSGLLCHGEKTLNGAAMAHGSPQLASCNAALVSTVPVMTLAGVGARSPEITNSPDMSNTPHAAPPQKKTKKKNSTGGPEGSGRAGVSGRRLLLARGAEIFDGPRGVSRHALCLLAAAGLVLLGLSHAACRLRGRSRLRCCWPSGGRSQCAVQHCLVRLSARAAAHRPRRGPAGGALPGRFLDEL